MKQYLKGIGRRNVRKAISITPDMEKVLGEMSIATGGKLSPGEIISILLDAALMKSNQTFAWFEYHYVNRDKYCFRIVNENGKRTVKAVQV